MTAAGARAALLAEKAAVQNFITEAEGTGLEARHATESATLLAAQEAFQPWQDKMMLLRDHRERLVELDAQIAMFP
jgi:hypothetical protein